MIWLLLIVPVGWFFVWVLCRAAARADERLADHRDEDLAQRYRENDGR